MSTKKKTLRKTEVEKENKKPPVIEATPNVEDNQEITPEQEKALYEGQEHIEENSQNQSYQSNQLVTEIQDENSKRQIITKPRETYLQEKLSKIDFNQNLVSNIKKELNDQIKTVAEDDNILITEVPRNLNKYIKKFPGIRNNSVDFSSKQKYKQLKVLKDEQNVLKKNLKQVEENEKLLQDEGFINLNNSKKGKSDSMFDKGIKEHELKLVQQKKNKIVEKIKDIELKILNIIESDNILTNKEKTKLFIDNFERDKEIAEIRAKKYLKESKERSQRMKNDINQLIEKRKKEIEKKDKEDKIQKEELIKKFKEKERAIELKQSKQNNEIMEKYKQFRDKNLEKKGKDYRYSQIYEKYIKQEEKVYKDAAEKRHKLYNSAKIEEIKEFTKKVNDKKEKDEIQREQKKIELNQNWKKNKENLPKCNYDMASNEENTFKKEEEIKKKKEEMGARRSLVEEFSDKVREKYAPEIDDKKKSERERKIYLMEVPINPKKYTMNKQKKKRILLKKRDNSKPSKFKWELKLEYPAVDKFDEQNKNLIKKPKRINLSPIERTKLIIPDKKPDYLREIINKKEVKNRALSSSKVDEDEELNTNQQSKKWEKVINNNSATLLENINNVKEQANSLEKQAEMNEKLLKLNGGIENNPELGKKVSSLLINSIEAKLSILKKVNDA
jgi:hypothetical protein